MDRLWSVADIAGLIGISPECLKLWERDALVPTAIRIGRRKKRVWGKSKTLMILEYARDSAGYPIPDRVFDQVRSG